MSTTGERLLDDVLGLVDVADHGHHLPDQPGVVGAVEPLEVGSGHGLPWFAALSPCKETPATGPPGSLPVSSPV